MDSTGADAAGFFPQLMDMPPHNEDGVGGAHLYVPWWLAEKKQDFRRGYHMELWGGRGMPGYGFGWNIHELNGRTTDADGSVKPRSGGGYVPNLKEDYRRYYGAVIGLSGRGEMIARKENYCEIDPGVVDKFGIPVLRFHASWSDEEYRQIKHFQTTARELIEAAGGTPLGEMPDKENGYGILAPGRIIHEVGVTRMGADPKSSVLNSNCQAHEVKNLFVADGGPFVSQAHKNPTWTILALAMRTSEYIADARNRLDL